MKDLSHLNIIYIAGYGRSGSTLLSQILNTKEELTSLGEVERLFWIDEDYPAYWEDLKKEVLINLESKKIKLHNSSTILWFLFNKKKAKTHFGNLWVAPLIKIAKDCNATTLIDSSKSTMRTFSRPMNYKALGAKIKVIHIIRDAHGVVSSYRKGRNLSNSSDLGRAKIGGSLRCIMNWFLTNSLTLSIYPKYFDKNEFYLLDYDRLMEDYENEITRLFEFLNIPVPPVILKDKIRLENDFGFSGNRMRLKDTISLQYTKPKKQKGVMGSIINTAQWLFNRKIHKLTKRNFFEKDRSVATKKY